MSPGKIRAKVVTDKLALIERMLAGIDTLPLETEEALVADPRMVAAGESFLRRTLEALFDLGRHVLAKGFGDPVAEYKEIADHLGEHGVLDGERSARLREMAGYRNRLVHFYDEVTPSELYRILTSDLDEVRDLLASLRRWVTSHPDLIDHGL